jgi:preprotein translocase subunit SecE
MNWKDNPVAKYLIEAKVELKKVAWPTRKETLNYTLIVIGVSLGIALFLGAADFGLSAGIQALIARK